MAGETHARLRCTTDGVVSFTDAATDGEVEDYLVTIAILSADISGDGCVNPADLSTLVSQLGCAGECTADLDGNGEVNLADLSIMGSQWGAGCATH